MSEGFANTRLRLSYARQGLARYLSAFETISYFERCIRRSGLPFALTAGDNPRMLLVFGAPIQQRMESAHEILDVHLREPVEPDVALRMIQDKCVFYLRPFACRVLDQHEPGADELCANSTYRLNFAQPTDTLKLPERLVIERTWSSLIYLTADYLLEAPRPVSPDAKGASDVWELTVSARMSKMVPLNSLMQQSRTSDGQAPCVLSIEHVLSY